MNDKVLEKLSYGLFICTAKDGNKDNGCIINTVMQVTVNPMRIMVAVNKSNYTHDMIMNTRKCNISVISQDADFELFKHFGFQSGKDVDKFDPASGAWMKENKDYCVRTPNEVMSITKGTNAHVSLWVENTVDLDSHTLFICMVVDGDVLNSVPSATYEYYHANIKRPLNNPSENTEGKKVWRCKICGFEYVGDELPEDYICPLCKHPASDFELVEN